MYVLRAMESLAACGTRSYRLALRDSFVEIHTEAMEYET